MPSSPLIGFTLDYETGGGYSKMPFYAIRENYFAAVMAHGAAPLALPYDMASVGRYLDLIRGLVVIGGAFDVSPALYGAAEKHGSITLKESRTAFEWAITEEAIRRKKPILGVCGGEQLLNVVLGGTLIQHIPDAVPDCLAHEQPNPRSEPGHAVAVTPGTLLHRIVGKESIEVNSAHHQAVAAPGRGVVVNAVAADGVIEGVEVPGHPFCLGVQWHPEYHVTPADRAIFAAFVAACGEK